MLDYQYHFLIMQANELIQLTQGFRIGSADSDRIGFNLNPIRSLTKKNRKDVRLELRETLETLTGKR